MRKLQNFIMIEYLGKLGRIAYAANDLLNLIEKIEKVYSDDQLQLIKRIISDNYILETSDRRPCLKEIEIVRGCVYNLDTWLVNNNIKCK